VTRDKIQLKQSAIGEKNRADIKYDIGSNEEDKNPNSDIL